MRKRLLHLLLAGLTLASCQTPTPERRANMPTAPPTTPAPVVSPAIAGTLATPAVALEAVVPSSGNEFAWAATRKVLGAESAIFSPFSLREALGLLHLGARGDTSAALAKLCGFPPGTQSFVREHEAQSTALRALEPAIVWRSSNALFVDKGTQLEPEYQKTAERIFRARAESVDFTDVQTVALINQWVARQIEGKIKKLLSRLPSDTRAVLLNAVYLQATWQEKFDEQRTRPQTFFDGKTNVQVPTMQRTGTYPLYTGKGWRLLELPYRGGRLVFDCILPDRRDGLGDVLQRLDLASLEAGFQGLQHEEVELSLPRFTIESDWKLLDTLQAMGFRPNGDYSGLSKQALQITGVLQKAFIEVDETGSEATAATAIVVGEGAAPGRKVRFQVDRPFLYLIRDRKTRAILFTGQVYKP
jgi:serpin B